MSQSSLFAVTWEAGGGQELGEAGNCLAGVNFGRGGRGLWGSVESRVWGLQFRI
jgi:hypothetical protein